MGRRCIELRADLTSIEPIPGMMYSTLSAFGRLDILVNNAGTIRRADAVDFSEQDWDDVMNVNLKSAFFLWQAAGRHFIANGGGKIVNIASMLSFQRGIRVPSYSASKSGIAGITRLLANEWGGKGVNVNAIAPGALNTRLLDERAARDAVAAAEAETGLVADDPVRFGSARLLDAIVRARCA